MGKPVRPSRNMVEERHRNHVSRLRIRAPCSTGENMLSEGRPGVLLTAPAPSPTPEPKGIVLSLWTIVCTEYDQSGSTTRTGELRIGMFLPSPRHLQGFPVHVSSPSPSSAVPVERRHLVSIASWAPPCRGSPSTTTSNRLPSNRLGSVRSMSRTNVQTNTCSAFPANPCCRRLQRPTPSPQHPCCCAGCTVVAKSVEWTATPATANRNGKGQSKSSDHRPSRGLALAIRHSSSGVAQLTKRPAVANPCVADTDPLLLLPHLVRSSARCAQSGPAPKLECTA